MPHGDEKRRDDEEVAKPKQSFDLNFPLLLIVSTFFFLLFFYFILRLKVANGDKFIVGHFQFPLHLHASIFIYVSIIFIQSHGSSIESIKKDNDDDNNFLINEHAIYCAALHGR